MKLKSLFPIIFLIVIVFYSFSNKKTIEINGPVLVELFTSQGCSSCPRADEVLKEIKETYKDENVIPLSFHVDYWDYLGWKDTFSQAKFSARQRDYAKRFNNRSIYTPQMVVNGVEEFVGSNRIKAFQAIDKVTLKASIFIDGSYKNNKKKITINYKLPKVNYEKYNLNVALVKNEETVAIKRGENWGKKITYHNIVIDFLKIENLKSNGVLEFLNPSNLEANNFSVVLYLQERGNGKIVGVKKLDYS